MEHETDESDGILVRVTRSSGESEHERWSIVSDEGERFVRIHDESEDDETWEELDRSAAAMSSEELASGCSDMIILETDAYYRIEASPNIEQDLLAMLTVFSPGRLSWRGAEADVLGGNCFLVLAWPDGGDIGPILGDWEAIDGIVRGHHTWSDNNFMTWTGGSTLTEFEPGWAVETPYGDFLEMGARQIIELGTAPAERADGVLKWLENNAGGHAMAILDLEPFDPNQRLTVEQHEKWNRALADDRWTLDLSLDEPTTTVLRERLVPDDVRAAFFDPNGPAGQKLLEYLADSTFLDTHL